MFWMADGSIIQNRLAFYRPTKGPQEGGTSHIHDKVRANASTVDDDRPLFANTEDLTKAFGGQVGRRPGPTMTLAVSLDQPAERRTPCCPPPPAPPSASTLARPLTILATATSVKGGQRLRLGVTFCFGGSSGGDEGGEGVPVRENILGEVW
jgi:hypothetical protein